MLLLSSMALLLVGAAMVRAAGQVNTHAMNMYKHPFNGDVRTTLKLLSHHYDFLLFVFIEIHPF